MYFIDFKSADNGGGAQFACTQEQLQVHITFVCQ